MSGFEESSQPHSELAKEVASVAKEEPLSNVFLHESVVSKEEDESGMEADCNLTSNDHLASSVLTCKEEYSPVDIKTEEEKHGNLNQSSHEGASLAEEDITRTQPLSSPHSGRNAGEKSHQCPDCGKAFHYIFTLKAHRRSHQGVRARQPSTSGETSRPSSHVRRHQRKRSGVNPHRRSSPGETSRPSSRGCRSHCKKTACFKVTAYANTRKHLLASLQRAKRQKHLSAIRAASVGKADRVAHLEHCLAARTAELAAEKARANERDAEIACLKLQNDKLKQTIQRLQRENGHLDILQEMRAGFGELQAALRGQRGGNSTQETSPISEPSQLAVSDTISDIVLVNQHADVTLHAVSPEDHARIYQQSHGQVGRYGCLLFRAIISDEDYKAWSKTTNWDGSRGKRALPHNVKHFVVSTLKRKFPAMGSGDLKDCIDKINEFLRTTRRSTQKFTELEI